MSISRDMMGARAVSSIKQGMGVTCTIQCGGVREMNKLTNEKLVKYAEAIKDFCEGGLQDCDDCPFHEYGGGCALGVPGDWVI